MTKHNTIYTLPILRNEIKVLNCLKKERKVIINNYVASLRELGCELYKVEKKLIEIKSPGIGDGLGGTVKDNNYNYLIQRKYELKDEITDYIDDNYSEYWERMYKCNMRIATVYYYLNKMDTADRKFIEDLYINNIRFRDVMDRYNIKNEGNLYRKANNIIRKIL
ncbi:hypothetical protein [Thomasclavelia cocleata]|uniref:hypothetical protein n=1 Tax=Thomasclavelia cocleata TaxID=69824 RepID=UPI002575039E|nr:hypothetical protein [Thomasclavelia cocleata]